VQRVRAALAEQGFGVRTEIDMRATLRDKLNAQMEDYLILGAATHPWPTGHWTPTATSACSCPATS
jgi:uncharacterized protein (DUF302 family)